MKYSTLLISFLFIFLACHSGSSQQNYVLSEGSILTVQGTSTVHDWTMELDKMKGYLKWENGIPKSIFFEAQVADLQSERSAIMDSKAREALKIKEHPMITFESVQGSVQQPEINICTLPGEISIAGTAKKISITSKIKKGRESILLEGSCTILLQDFNIVPPTAMFGSIVVGDVIMVHFNLLYHDK
ncbi:MAG: YceI family protein [Sediminicola sp.]